MKNGYKVLLVVLLLGVCGYLVYVHKPTPAPQDEMADWVATSTAGYTYKYPREFDLQYVTPTDWPPKLEVKDEAFACGNPVNITGRDFCVTKESEGAAGSIYKTFAYAFAVGGNTAILSDVFQMPQCANYPEPKQSACKQEQESFDVDAFMAQVAGTVKLKS